MAPFVHVLGLPPGHGQTGQEEAPEPRPCYATWMLTTLIV
jgi:hypothetical protein